MVSYNLALRQVSMGAAVLILVVVEDGLVPPNPYFYGNSSCVLILVVVEDGLVLKDFKMTAESLKSLNPCCSGRWSRTLNLRQVSMGAAGLNPCCSGRWSRTLIF